MSINEALKGGNKVFPNPRVGCVIVKDGNVVSTGFHEKFGSPHAEVMAIENLSTDIVDATLYVTLEPCNHHGKTPPCASIINSGQIKRVVIGSKDPNSEIQNGIAALRDKGIDVEVGVNEDKARSINPRFFTYHEKKRPYIILKYAATLDGFLAEPDGKSKWITSSRSRGSVHLLRSTCDAILVGRRTVEKDDPSLTSHGIGKDPTKVILDPSKKITKDYSALDKHTIHFSSELRSNSPIENIDIVLNKLYQMNIQSLLVEGGAITISHFLESEMFDEIHAYYGPKLIGKGKTIFNGEKGISELLNLSIVDTEIFDNDIKITYKRD
tara:strand:+ start:2047 stop:3024 length:978 start_codon:yes stop_codon:yes gene_type:complete